MDNTNEVSSHYGTSSLRDRVSAALEAAGLGAETVPWRALAPLDQFHMRGLPATEELASQLDLGREAHVLDVGSGLGGPSRYLAATFGCRVTGIDLSAPFVDVATMLAQRSGLAERVRYRQADALDLPFDAGSFDVVWTQHVAMNIRDRARLYGEMRRVLRPGGRLAIYDVIASPTHPILFPVPWAREANISFLVTAEDMRTVLEQAGFSVVTWTDSTQSAVAWLDQQAQRAAPAATGPAPLGIHVVMGPDFPALAANLARNIRDDRARLVQAVLS